jgi:hypothetical protein
LFGSDGPWLHPGLELHKVRLLGLPPDQEGLILGGNIIRLLHQVRSEADPKDIRQARRARSSSPSAGMQAIEASNSLPPGTQTEYEL